ncbi:MAG: Response regulatory protein [Anaerolineales bacterium]|nr:Response regulatory protein [Anaerolineales bacterium]MBM2849717.1 Response regulatory protein [Anaerolineales bacterium]
MPEKILIVDDDLDTLKLVGLILQRHGYDIVAANGGLPALQKAAAERPDIILLDLMMPDLDGYEVTRRLRADTSLAHIPIIMFTAKTMLDDKVAGFEAGADDYLTKPTHPSELIAHVKALLARSQGPRAAQAADRGRMVGFLSAKGGVGLTTIALNFAALATQSGQDVILADLHPGSGSLSLMLGLTQSQSLAALVAKPVGDINQRAVGAQLVSHASGLRVLPCAVAPGEAGLMNNVTQVEAIVKTLNTMCKLLVLDLGTGIVEATRRIAPMCETVTVITDPTRPSVLQTKALLADLNTLGLTTGKIDVVIVNRAPSSIQMSWQQVEQLLGYKVALIITPAAELAQQAVEAGMPMVLVRPESFTAEQIKQLTTQVVQKIRL